MADTKTILNPGVGGDAMDESLVTTSEGAVKRPRVVPGGDDGSLQTFTAESGRTKADVKDASVLAELAGVVKKLFDMQPTVIYVGQAPLGAASSAASWLIQKINLDASGNPTQIRWTANTAIWDDRVTETYT